MREAITGWRSEYHSPLGLRGSRTRTLLWKARRLKSNERVRDGIEKRQFRGICIRAPPSQESALFRVHHRYPSAVRLHGNLRPPPVGPRGALASGLPRLDDIFGSALRARSKWVDRFRDEEGLNKKGGLILQMESNPALTASILRKAASGASGTVQVAKELHIGPARVITLSRSLRDEGLAEIQTVHPKSAGRPLVKIVPTSLGREYLKAFDELNAKTLKSRPADLFRAIADAEYTRRLAERGLSPTSLLLELNSLVVPLRKPTD